MVKSSGSSSSSRGKVALLLKLYRAPLELLGPGAEDGWAVDEDVEDVVVGIRHRPRCDMRVRKGRLSPAASLAVYGLASASSPEPCSAVGAASL